MNSLLAYVVWNPSPIIAHLGPITPRWYGVLFALGFVIGSYVLSHIYKSENVSPRWVDVITFYMVAGTVLGARLGHVFFYDWDKYKDHPLDILKIWEGGLASHGATVGILLAVWLFARRNKFDYLWTLDRIVIVVAIGGALIRLGNLVNSEIVGKPTDVPWAFVFPRDAEHLETPVTPLPAGAKLVGIEKDAHGEFAPRVLPGDAAPAPGQDLRMAVPRHPTQIYESLFCLVLLALLYGLWNRTKERTPRGLLFGLFVVLLFTFRFLVEFLKENQVAKEKDLLQTLHLNIGQLLSIPLVLVGLWVLLRAGKNPQNPYGYAPRDLEPEKQAA